MSREKLKEIPSAIEKLLEAAKINFNVLEDEGCCGSVLLRTGFIDDALDIMQDTYEDLKGEKVLVSCAGCYKTFKQDYPELLDKKVDVLHTSHLFWELIKNGTIKPSKTMEPVTYHDPCHLGRHMGEYETPRLVINSLAKIIEMNSNRENAGCCGSGGGVRSAFFELSTEIARLRMEEALNTGTRRLVTSCPFCIHHLQSAQETEQTGEERHVDILDLSQFLLLGLKKEAEQ